jgi:hypothetical protein
VMRHCPVCETPVTGSICPLCGKQLGVPGAPAALDVVSDTSSGVLSVVSNTSPGVNVVSNTSSALSGALFVPDEPVEGLEFTRLEVPDGLALALEPTPGLEPTGAAAVPEIPGEPLLGWEATVGAPVAAAQVGELPELDRGRAIAEAGSVTVPAPRTCPYCRRVQPEGLLCEQCGMRLPPRQNERSASSRTATATGEHVRCRQCGERTPIEWERERCGACGALLPAPEA